MKHGVPQGSVLGPLLFLVYINDLHKAIKYCMTHHFADDTNLLLTGSNFNEIQRKVNKDLKFLCNWLRGNKISLNSSKTELIIFRDPKKKITQEIKIKIEGKRLSPCRSVKYLGIYLDSHLDWHSQLAVTTVKLNRALGILTKIRHYVLFDMLKMVYYAIFSSILSYGSQIWGQCNAIIKKLQIIQNKALRVISFQSFRASATPLFKNCDILKIVDLVNFQNFMFAYDNLKTNLPLPLCNKLSFVPAHFGQRSAERFQLNRYVSRTIIYGSRCIYSQSIDIWNSVNKSCNDFDFLGGSRNKIKKKIRAILFSKYT